MAGRASGDDICVGYFIWLSLLLSRGWFLLRARQVLRLAFLFQACCGLNSNVAGDLLVRGSSLRALFVPIESG